MLRHWLNAACVLVLCGVSAVASAQHGGGPPSGGSGPGAMRPGMGGMMTDGRTDGIQGGGAAGGSRGFTRGDLSTRPGMQLGLSGRWWDDQSVSRSLNLSGDQQKRMDSIFEANKTQLYAAYSNLQREEHKLSSMTSTDRKDETKVFASIDRVAQARAELEKRSVRIQMQLRHELDQDQLHRLDEQISH
ncbi:MAG: hypothetical protein PW735_04535 [Acidobacteriaceae bacterium]|nr:hypothetical protein [Acidobacteriaceae bacterium]